MITQLEFILLEYISPWIKKINPKILYWIAKRISAWYFLFVSRGKNNIIYNLKYFLPSNSGKINKLAREIFYNFSIFMVDFFRIPLLNSSNIDKWVEIEGMENLDKAFKHGKGVVGVTAHLGNWEWINAIFSLKGYKTNVIYLNLGHEKLDNTFRKIRTYFGSKVILMNMQLKEGIRALRKNEILGLLIDRNISKKGVSVNFFNRKVLFPKGIIKFALKYSSPIIIGFCLKIKNKYKLIIEKPLVIERTNNLEDNIKITLQKIISKIEKYIQQYPDQWFMFHRFIEV